MHSKDNSEFTGTVFHRINSRLETGVHVDWTVGSNETKFGVGAKYCPDRDTALRVLELTYCFVKQFSGCLTLLEILEI